MYLPPLHTCLLTNHDCELWITFEFIFAYLAFIAASLLIVLRVIAIWNKHKVVTAISLGVWVTDIAFLIQELGIVRLRAAWVLERRMCAILNIESSKLNIIVALITDITLLLIMLVGLLGLRRYGVGTFGLGRLLWKQVVSFGCSLPILLHLFFCSHSGVGVYLIGSK